MALTKPILYSQSAFDATQDHTFTFNVVGGDQVVANQLVITDQNSGLIVYQQRQTSYSFAHTVAPDVLQNGRYYSAYLTVFNSQGEQSLSSNSIQFYCYSTPIFQFGNIPVSGIIENANYNFSIYYRQAEGEKLSNYIFYLYDIQRTELTNSGLKYVVTDEEPIDYLVSGLNDSTVYYIRCVGVTAEGTTVDTGYVLFTVKYKKSTFYSITELSNNCQGGYILVKSNFTVIDGISYPSPPNYIYNNTMIDVTGENDYVEWDSGYIIDGDFTASLWGKNFGENKPIITFTDEDGNNIIVSYRKNTDDKYYIDCMVTSHDISYYIHSVPIDIWANFAKQQIWLRRINGIYEIELHLLDEEPSSHTSVLGEAVLGWMILGED